MPYLHIQWYLNLNLILNKEIAEIPIRVKKLMWQLGLGWRGDAFGKQFHWDMVQCVEQLNNRGHKR